MRIFDKLYVKDMLKKQHTLFLLIMLLLISCSKKTYDTPEIDITGNWDWAMTVGGVAGFKYTPLSTGEIIYLEISKKSIKKYVNSMLESTQNYSISVEKINSADHGTVITQYLVYNNQKMKILLDSNELIFSDTYDDGFQQLYIKK